MTPILPIVMLPMLQIGFLAIFRIENISIVKVTDLGRLNPEKPRPLLVNLSDSSSRKYLLQNARMLRGNSECNRVYISPDLSPKERELNKKLHTELKRHKQAGETNLIFKKGKIVTNVAGSSGPQQNTVTQN